MSSVACRASVVNAAGGNSALGSDVVAMTIVPPVALLTGARLASVHADTTVTASTNIRRFVVMREKRGSMRTAKFGVGGAGRLTDSTSACLMIENCTTLIRNRHCPSLH